MGRLLRRLAPALVAAPVVALYACDDGTDPDVETRSSLDLEFGTGTRDTLTYAVGQQVPLSLGATLSTQTCIIEGAGCDGGDCTISDFEVKVELLDVECSRPDCHVNDALELHCSEAGLVIVSAIVRVQSAAYWEGSNGTPVPGERANVLRIDTVVRFAVVDRVAIVTQPYADAGALHAALVGAEIDWRVAAYSAQGESITLDARDIAWRGDAVQSVPPPTHPPEGTWAGVVAQQAGEATLTFRALGFTREQSLRVADPGEVVAIDLVPAHARLPYDVDVAAEQLEPDSTLDAVVCPLGALTAPLAVRLQLTDGTTALGGAGTVVVDPPDLATIVIPGSATFEPSAARDARPMLSLVGYHPGEGTLRVAVGSVQRDYPLEVSAREGGDGGSGGAGGAGAARGVGAAGGAGAAGGEGGTGP